MKKTFIAEQKLENLILILVIFSLSWRIFGKTIFKFNLSKMRASNWRSDIFLVIELGLDSPFHITVQPRNTSDFFGFVKIPAQNLLLPSVRIYFRV